MTIGAAGDDAVCTEHRRAGHFIAGDRRWWKAGCRQQSYCPVVRSERSISSIRGLLVSGYNSGNWNGIGIDTSAATGSKYGLGYADGADGGISGITSGQIEVKYTLYGDTNLDGAVNSIDFGDMAANFGKSGKVWDQGDFNYDGVVNSIDFGLSGGEFREIARKQRRCGVGYRLGAAGCVRGGEWFDGGCAGTVFGRGDGGGGNNGADAAEAAARIAPRRRRGLLGWGSHNRIGGMKRRRLIGGSWVRAARCCFGCRAGRRC